MRFTLVAIAQVGSTQYVKHLSQWDWQRSVRQIFPCDINGSTEKLPLTEYKQWADEVFHG